MSTKKKSKVAAIDMKPSSHKLKFYQIDDFHYIGVYSLFEMAIPVIDTKLCRKLFKYLLWSAVLLLPERSITSPKWAFKLVPSHKHFTGALVGITKEDGTQDFCCTVLTAKRLLRALLNMDAEHQQWNLHAVFYNTFVELIDVSVREFNGNFAHKDDIDKYQNVPMRMLSKEERQNARRLRQGVFDVTSLSENDMSSLNERLELAVEEVARKCKRKQSPSLSSLPNTPKKAKAESNNTSSSEVKILSVIKGNDGVQRKPQNVLLEYVQKCEARVQQIESVLPEARALIAKYKNVSSVVEFDQVRSVVCEQMKADMHKILAAIAPSEDDK